jgi:hypothetical protein
MTTSVPENIRPILVTGGHRTGTTWVGKMLSASGETAYISEPLNILHRPGVFRKPLNYWYSYICTENEAEYLSPWADTLRLRYQTLAELRAIRSLNNLLHMGRDWSTFARGRLRRQRPLLKDPFALFSVPWFVERLNCQVVVTVRHPAAFASSIKRLGWPFQLEDLLAQPLLMRDWLEPFRPEITGIPPEDIITRASLLWKMAYTVVEELQKRYPERVRTVRHEDLSLDPIAGYRSLYQALELSFTHQAKKAILSSSSSENPKEISRNAIHSTRLDSRANLYNWKRRLQPADLACIRQITAEVAGRYYPDADWE